jgi:hypothetical protein
LHPTREGGCNARLKALPPVGRPTRSGEPNAVDSAGCQLLEPGASTGEPRRRSRSGRIGTCCCSGPAPVPFGHQSLAARRCRAWPGRSIGRAHRSWRAGYCHRPSRQLPGFTTRPVTPQVGGHFASSRPVAVPVAFACVQRGPKDSLQEAAPQVRTVTNAPGHPDEQLESVFGATPHEFKPRILRTAIRLRAGAAAAHGGQRGREAPVATPPNADSATQRSGLALGPGSPIRLCHAHAWLMMKP